MSTLDTILAFLQSKGFSSAQAAGVAGNFQVESGFDPAAYNPQENAIGLAQWQGGRRTNLQAYARSTGGAETDLLTQLNFFMTELQGPESSALAKLTATNDPGAAAAVVDQYYERSSGEARAQRIANAQAIASGADPSEGFLGRTRDAITGVVGGAVDAINPFDNWQHDATTLALKLGAVTVAGALVVAGAIHTVSDK